MTTPIIVRIEWYDSHSSDKWGPVVQVRDEMSDMMLCETIGFQLLRNKECVVIAHTLAWKEEICPTTCGVMHIPIKCIKSIITL
jgi:hypothetical protein